MAGAGAVSCAFRGCDLLRHLDGGEQFGAAGDNGRKRLRLVRRQPASADVVSRSVRPRLVISSSRRLDLLLPL